MKRALSLVGMALITLLFPAPARADVWDWLSEFSGPGPFHTRNLNLMTPCVEEIKATSEEAMKPVSVSQPKTCWWVDYRSFTNKPDQDDFRAGRVDIHVTEAGASVKVHRAIDIGFGAGAMFFDSDNGEPFTRAVLTVPRVVITPALLFGSDSDWTTSSSTRLRRLKSFAKTVKYYFKENIVLGPLSQEDFGLTPTQSNFKVTNDRVFSSGFILDLNEIGRLITGR